jgi:aspartate-semialdehyde dehydrogenase
MQMSDSGRGLRVGILGATGAVGQEIVKCLERRRFPVSALRLLASARSVGTTMPFCGERLSVEELTPDRLSGLDVLLCSAGSAVAAKFAPIAVRHGAVVIDNSSAFRMDADVPLVIPEVNPEAAFTHRGACAG